MDGGICKKSTQQFSAIEMKMILNHAFYGLFSLDKRIIRSKNPA